MKIPIRNVYYLLCYAVGQWDGSDLVEVEELDRLEQVHDLLARILANGTFGLLRRGIDQGYREFTIEIPGVRGKLEVSATAKRALRSRGRTVCSVEEFTPDVLHNRILRSTLDFLRRLPGLDPRVEEDVSLAFEKMRGVKVVPLNRGLFRRVQLDRNQRRYRFLLSICLLVLDSMLMSEQDGDLPMIDFRRDEKMMWRLFEDFVTAFLAREQSEFRIRGQARLQWADAVGRSPADLDVVPNMRPDVVAESDSRRVILDAKFYQSPLKGGGGGTGKLRAGNLYQLAAYLTNRQAQQSEGARHEGILLYAAVDETVRADFMLNGYRIQARTVDLSRHWVEVREELLGVLE